MRLLLLFYQLVYSSKVWLLTSIRTHFNCANLETYFKNLVATHGKTALPSIDELVKIAGLLVARYATTPAFEQAVGAHPMEDIDSEEEGATTSAPIGEKWNEPVIPCAEEKPRSYEHSDGDWVLGNSILFLRDALEFLEACTATARGDPERAWETYKVRQCMLVAQTSPLSYFL